MHVLMSRYDSSDVETVVQHLSEQESGFASESEQSIADSPAPVREWCTWWTPERRENARDFFVLSIVTVVLIDLYAQTHWTLWWSPPH